MITRHPVTDRASWLAMRRGAVNASEIAAACGVSPRKTLLRLWAEKTGLIGDGPDSGILRRGRWLEDGVLNALKDEGGRPHWKIEKPGFYYLDPDARIGCTPDALAFDDEGGQGVVQCKVVSRPVFDADWQDGPPDQYLLQTLTEIMLTGSEWGCVAALVLDTWSADLHIFPLERHEGAWAKIRECVAKFWADTDAGIEPRADYARDGELLNLLKPPGDDEPIDLGRDNRIPVLLEERKELKATEKAAETRLKEINAELVDKLNGHRRAVCGRWKISNTMTHRGEYTVPPASFPTMRVTEAKEKGRAA